LRGPLLFGWAQNNLHKELDEQLGTEDETVATEKQVKRLPYLNASINEGLHLHSTSSLGLPGVAPEGGLMVMEKYFPAGTVLSVPSYTIHRDDRIWGDDVESFRPERWFERDPSDIQKTFNPFSTGPRCANTRLVKNSHTSCRACIGRNLAFLELQIIIGSIIR